MATPEQALILKASARANGDPLPGPLADAFCKGAIKIGDFHVRKIVGSDWPILRQIKSPIVELVQEVHQEPGKIPEVNITDQQEWELCFVFTHPVKESRELLSDGLERFKEAVQDFIDSGVSEPEVKLICRAVVEQVKRSWETALSHKADMEKEGITFFPETASPKTG